MMSAFKRISISHKTLLYSLPRPESRKWMMMTVTLPAGERRRRRRGVGGVAGLGVGVTLI